MTSPKDSIDLSAVYQKPFRKTEKEVSFAIADPFRKTVDQKEESLTKSIMNILDGGGAHSITRLAFERDPLTQNVYSGLYRQKQRLLPSAIIKKLMIGDDLIAAIIANRANHVSSFGRPQPDRHSIGYRIEPEPGITEELNSEQKKQLQDRIARAEGLILTCGQTRGWSDSEAMTFSQYLYMSTRDAVGHGQIACEVVYTGEGDQKKFHSFRPIDAGTIYKAAPQKHAADSVRRGALSLLEKLKGEKLIPERYVNDEYAYVQVVTGTPVQAFTSEECLVHNFYPSTDVELDGYPITPLDTIISAVTMHINATTHNRLVFESGRAARGILVIQSDDIDPRQTNSIRQHMEASINDVGRSWRTPILGVGTNDNVNWLAVDSTGRDMEYQYMMDSNARVILSAFQMSPEELAGYAHLSRGTNSQALSEGNNEFKLEAARDTGIRPLLAQWQSFINSRLLPLIDPELSKICHFKFLGMDAETAEKESIRLQQDLAVHMSMDEVMEAVQKKPVGKKFGGMMPLNPQWKQGVLDQYVMVGDILEHYFGVEGASKDPRFQYVRDQFWFQWQQLLMEQKEMEAQAQQAQQQPQPGQEQPQEEQVGDLTNTTNQLANLLNKSEHQLPASKKALLDHQRKIIEHTMATFEREAQDAIKDIVKLADQHVPGKNKKS